MEVCEFGCNSTLLSCIRPVCRQGEKRCDGKQLQICAADGMGFETSEVCDYMCDPSSLSCQPPPDIMGLDWMLLVLYAVVSALFIILIMVFFMSRRRPVGQEITRPAEPAGIGGRGISFKIQEPVKPGERIAGAYEITVIKKVMDEQAGSEGKRVRLKGQLDYSSKSEFGDFFWYRLADRTGRIAVKSDGIVPISTGFFSGTVKKTGKEGILYLELEDYQSK